VSPSPIQRLKPYFKPRPKPGRATPAAPAAPAAAQPAQPAPQAPAPGGAPAAAQPTPGAAPAPVAPPPADATALQARREQLAARYAELQSDLGGLVYEMAIRDHFRLDVVVRRAAELQAIDSELSSVEQRLGIATAAPATTTCQACGAPVQLGAQYCGRCGSSLAQSASGPPSARPGASAPPHVIPGTTTGNSGPDRSDAAAQPASAPATAPAAVTRVAPGPAPPPSEGSR